MNVKQIKNRVKLAWFMLTKPWFQYHHGSTVDFYGVELSTGPHAVLKCEHNQATIDYAASATNRLHKIEELAEEDPAEIGDSLYNDTINEDYNGMIQQRQLEGDRRRTEAEVNG